MFFLCSICLTCSVQSSGATSSQPTGPISLAELYVTIKSDGTAFVSQNLSYMFDSPVMTLPIPLVSSKMVITSAPVYLLVENNLPLFVKNGEVNVSSEGFLLAKSFCGYFPKNTSIALPEPAKALNVSLTYELTDVVTEYLPLLSHYQVLFDPLMSVSNFSLTVIVEGLNLPELASYYVYSSGGPNYVVHDPVAQSINTTVLLAQWNLKSLTPGRYPIVGQWYVSPLPGLAAVGFLPFISLTAALIGVIFEAVYFLGSLPAIRGGRKFGRRLALSSRLHPIMLGLGIGAWAVHEVIHRVHIRQFTYSWFLPIYYLVFLYWIIMFFFWPFINMFDYSISKRRKTLIKTTGDRFILWMRRSPKLSVIVFMFFFASLMLVFSALGAVLKWPIHDSALYQREPYFVIFSMSFLTAVFLCLYKVQDTLIEQQEKVSLVFNDLLEKNNSLSLKESVVVKECQKHSISSKDVRLAIESLSVIDGLIYREEDILHKMRAELFVPNLDNPVSDKEFMKETIRKKKQLEEFERKHGLKIRLPPTTDNLLEKMGIRRG